MRIRVIRAAALLLLAGLFASIPFFLSHKPPETRQMIRPPDEHWMGVLSLGIVETWRPGASSFTAYANKLAKEYEKANKGVLVAVREMEAKSLNDALNNGWAPDVLIFGTGAVEDAKAALLPLEGHNWNIRPEYLASGVIDGTQYALPIAAGGYCVMVNRDVFPALAPGDTVNWQELILEMREKGRMLQCPAPEGGKFPAAGLIAATDGMALTGGNALASNIAAIRRDFCWPDFVLENKYAAYLGTQYDIERIKVLRSAGRAFPTVALTGGSAYTDMVQYVALSRPAAGADEGRLAAAESLMSFFLNEQSREALFSLRVMPVDSGEPLYDLVEGMDALERSLSGPVYVLPAFSKPDANPSGLLQAENILRGLGWQEDLMENP